MTQGHRSSFVLPFTPVCSVRQTKRPARLFANVCCELFKHRTPIVFLCGQTRTGNSQLEVVRLNCAQRSFNVSQRGFVLTGFLFYSCCLFHNFLHDQKRLVRRKKARNSWVSACFTHRHLPSRVCVCAALWTLCFRHRAQLSVFVQTNPTASYF